MDAAWIAVAMTAVGALLGGGVTFGIAVGKLNAISERLALLEKQLEKAAGDHESRLRMLEAQRPPLWVHAGGRQGQA